MMKSFVFAGVFCALGTAVCAQSVTGLTVNSLKTYAYDSVISWTERDHRPAGVEEVAQVDGMVFLDIRAVMDVPWSDELSRLSISARDILVILPDGTEVQSCCHFEYWGMMHLSASSASVSRPSDFPEEDRDLYWHSMFLVPEGVSEVTLRMPNEEGAPGYEGVVPVPAVTVPQDAAMFAEFAVSDVEMTTQFALEAGRDTAEVTSVLSAPEGQVFVAFDVEVTPFSANEFDFDGRFYWHTYDFRLTGADGAHFALIGETFQDRIMDAQFNSASVGDDATRRVVFMVPQGTAAGVLMFGQTQVAEVAF